MKKFNFFTFISMLSITPMCILPTVSSCAQPSPVVTNKYTVTFVAGSNGSLSGVTTQTVDEGTVWNNVTKPYANPDDGYKFDDWYCGENKMTDETVINSNITVTAKFVLIPSSKVTISFAAGQHGSIGSWTPQTVNAGAYWSSIITPSYTPDSGYEFDGWYNGSTKLTSSSKINSSFTATAKFTKIVPQTVTISFTAGPNGTIDTSTPVVVTAGTTWGEIKKPGTHPDTDFIDDGWYNGDTLLTDSTPINSSFTATAKFKATTNVNINFQSSTGGSIVGGPTTISVPRGTTWLEVNQPKVLPDSNFSFEGWYNNTSKMEDDTPINSSITVTPKFEAIQLTRSVAAKFYVPDSETTSYVEYSNKSWVESVFGISHFNDSACGYINIDNTLTLYGDYSSTTSDGVTTLTFTTNGSKCVIDHIYQTITFDQYEKFFDFTTYGPMTGGCNGGKNYFNNVTSNCIDNGLEINLSKYHIKSYCYNGNCYLPWELFKNLFDYETYDGVNNWDYNGNGYYYIVDGFNSSVVPYKTAVKNAAPAGFYSSDYMEYIYNLFAFTLDLRYGMTTRESRANPGTTLTYLNGDALKTLEPYHADIASTKDDKSSDAIRKVAREVIDDGGHTSYFNLNALSANEVPAKPSNFYGQELNKTAQVSDNLESARTSAGKDVPSDKTGYYEVYTPADASKGKIAYLTFDSFTSQSGLVSGETTRELPGTTTDDNYGNDTLRLTMYANKKIKADPTIKNLVIDLSLNGGGVVYAEHFIASWLCGGVNEKIYNPKTNSYCEYRVEADIDGDGDFDEDDKLSNDINLFVITSTNSFSCGNMLPCNIQDDRSSAIFIGTKSGGGACFVDSDMQLGCNSLIRLSSTKHMLRKASTSTNFVSVDSGCTITSGWEINDSTTTGAAKYYDRDSINALIWAL